MHISAQNYQEKYLKWLACASALIGFVLMIPGQTFNLRTYQVLPSVQWEGFWGFLFIVSSATWLVQSFRQHLATSTFAISILATLWVILSLSLAVASAWLGCAFAVVCSCAALRASWLHLQALREESVDVPRRLGSPYPEGRVVWRPL